MAEFFVWADGPFFESLRRLSLTQEMSDALEQLFLASSKELLSVQELIPLSSEPFSPDESEAWVIENFSLPEVVASALQNPIGSPVAGRDIGDWGIRCLVGHGLDNDKDVVAFQVMDRRQVLTAKGLSLILDGDVFRRLQDPGLLIGNQVHAVHTAGRLVFRSLWWARRIFDLAEHYAEATREQVEAFVKRSDVVVRAEDFADTASQWERKRIGYLIQSGLLDKTTPSDVKKKASDYGIAVELERVDGRERLVIPEDAKERRNLLKFLEEDYYHGPLTDTRYVANSKRRV